MSHTEMNDYNEETQVIQRKENSVCSLSVTRTRESTFLFLFSFYFYIEKEQVEKKKTIDCRATSATSTGCVFV